MHDEAHRPQRRYKKTFTSTIEAVVARKHDPAAHNVPFEAAWSKRVPNSAALEQFPIICKQRLISALCHMSGRYNEDTDTTVKTTRHNIRHDVCINLSDPSIHFLNH